MSRSNFFLSARFALAIAIFAVIATGCNSKSSNEQKSEKPIAVSTQQPSAEEAKPVKLPPPTQAEVEAAFHRVFGDDLVANPANRQSYIVGDFNGDGSEDLAVIARPAAGKLTDVNSELSNWI